MITVYLIAYVVNHGGLVLVVRLVYQELLVVRLGYQELLVVRLGYQELLAS